MQVGDLVVASLKTTSQIAVGEVAGPFVHKTDGQVSRKVKWLQPDLPRETFKQDLLFSFGAFMTVCEISRNDALRRVEAVIKNGKDLGFESGADKPTKLQGGTKEAVADIDVDLAEITRDQIERKIASTFTGHDFTRLVAEILKAQRYSVNVSPPGADNGIDIVAEKGALSCDRETPHRWCCRRRARAAHLGARARSALGHAAHLNSNVRPPAGGVTKPVGASAVSTALTLGAMRRPCLKVAATTAASTAAEADASTLVKLASAKIWMRFMSR